MQMKGGGSLHTPSHETVDNGWHYVYQDGKAVFKVAVLGMADVSVEIMQRNNLSSDDVAWLVPHQANLRIIDATAQRLKMPKERVIVNIDRYGNTTAATLPLAFETARQEGKLKKGALVLVAAVGAGFTAGASLLRWAY